MTLNPQIYCAALDSCRWARSYLDLDGTLLLPVVSDFGWWPAPRAPYTLVNDGAAFEPGSSLQISPHGTEPFIFHGHTVEMVSRSGLAYRYWTEAPLRLRHAAEDSELRRCQIALFEAKRGDYDARVEALPGPLKARMERFRRIGGDAWRYDYEPYELFCCEQAALLAAAVLDERITDLVAFGRLGFYAQSALVPGFSSEHTGLTLRATVILMQALTNYPELVESVHGALCPAVPCARYGCYAAVEQQELEERAS